MWLWDFVHYNLGMHVYEVLAIIVGIGMLFAGVIHTVKQKKREKAFEDRQREEEA